MARIARRIALTRGVLALEAAARALWPALTLAAFALVALRLGLFSGPFGIELRIAAAVLVGGVALIGAQRLRVPARRAAVARLDAGVTGQPLATLEDRQALGRTDPASAAVWAAHRARMEQAALTTRVPAPNLAVADRDPLALRLLAATALIAALLFVPAVQRLPADPIAPEAAPQLATGPAFEGWAEPPAYTGRPTLYLPEIEEGRTLELPVGTRITLRVYGGGGTLSESVSGAAAGLEETDDQLASASFDVTQAGMIRLSAGDIRRWDIAIVGDAPPTIALDGPVERTPDGETTLPYAASDDYGVAGARAVIALDLDAVDRRHGLSAVPVARPDLTLDLPMPFTGDGTEISEVLVEDLSQHPWAGLPVTLTLEATDTGNQTATAAPEALTLPGRRFFDPLAGAIVEQRRDLLWSPENGARVDMLLRAITTEPEGTFPSSKSYLIARSALRRLQYSRENGLTEAEIEDVADLLWRVAVLIEDGDLASAAERLARARERLEEAIRDGASEEEIAQLMQEFQDALQEYMRQLAQQQQGQQQQQAMGDNTMTMNQDQLQAMLDRLQQLMEEGRMAEAQELLERLQQFLENMQVTQGGPGQPGEGNQTMQDLQDTLRQQQDLADESFRQLQEEFQRERQEQQGQQGQQQGQQGQQPGQQGQQPGQGQQGQQPGQRQTGPGQGPGQADRQSGQRQPGDAPSPGDLADRQGALERLLNDLRSRIPGAQNEAGDAARRALENAERNMREAERALRDGDVPGALDRQADALDALREGMRQLGEEQRQAARDAIEDGNQAAQGQEGAPVRQDPLGRPQAGQGGIETSDEMIPDADAMRRNRELMDEIRRRAADQTRPQIEREYLRRLLDRF